MIQGRYLTMATSDDKPKKSELLRHGIDFIFGFENRKGQVLDYQMSSADGLSFSPQEFYAKIEQQLEARQIPGLEISRLEFAEGGMLSDQRTYLRLMRERLAFVTCAAPFGKVFFFSWRTVYVPALVRLWHILAALAFFFAVVFLLVKPLGIAFTIIALVTLMFAIAAVFRNASAEGFSDLDSILLKIPIVTTIYQDWFREETYYREDTRNLYLKILPELIQQIVEETCAAKGIKLEQKDQRSPNIADLSKPPSPDTKSPTG